MRLLVYHAGALGDFITIVPCLRLLRLELPGAELTLLGRPAFGELARHSGLIDRVLDASSATLAPLYSPDGGAVALRLLGPYERAILFTASRPLVASCRVAAPLTSVHAPFPEQPLSAYRFHLATVAAALGRDPAGAERRALATPLLSAGAGARPRRPVAFIHPGSGAAAKNWPAERFADVAAELRGRGLRILWSLGPADRAILGTVEGMARAGDELRRDASPTELAAELGTASLYIGMDSGVSHLAAAAGCPSVILFGPTNRAVWRPPGPHVRLVPLPLICPAPGRSGTACDAPPRGLRCERMENGVAGCLVATQPREVIEAIDELGRSRETGELALPGRHG